LDLARQSDVRWVSLDSKVQQSGDLSVFITWATSISSSMANTFANASAAVDSALGANGTYAYGAAVTGAFDGFSAEVTPGESITKVEAVLQLYASDNPVTGQDPVLSVKTAGVASKPVVLDHNSFSPCVGENNACTVFVDITAAKTWQWADFDSTQDLSLTIDQSQFNSTWTIYYDAVGLKVTSSAGTDVSDTTLDTSKATVSQLPKLNVPMMNTTSIGGGYLRPFNGSIDTSQLANAYNKAVRATDTWNTAPAYLQGTGTTVAVVDSGIAKNNDTGNRLIKSVNFNKAYHDSADRFGHGTFVGSIFAGNGTQSKKYIGIAPKSKLVNVRVSDDNGAAYESDVVSALQWVLTYKTLYHIQVVNLSLNSSVAQSYRTAPLDAAVEILWFNGIVVVVSAGNNGTGVIYPPANDPFVITVGAVDDNGTTSLADDSVATFSAAGVTEDGFAKPDLVAPGKNIVALLPDNANLTMGKNHPKNRVDAQYFSMSGTSISAPIVTGAVALLLQSNPSLTPDQVKYRLTATANTNWPGYTAASAGAGYLDIYAAVTGTTTQSANTGINVSDLLTTGSDPVNSSVSWNSVSWNSVSWNSVSWNSVSWNSVSWNSVSWNSVSWNSDYWEK
jgi:serine protease AprX